MGNYLYNGVELPALPEWDKKTHPYAYISEDVEGRIVFRMQKTLTVTATNSIYTDWEYMHYTFDGTTWGDYYEGYSPGYIDLDLFNIIWTNTNIFNYDGTLHLAASEPVPVSPVPQLNPAALMQGFATMLSLRK